ncbi:sugar phosphate isomerase/epimerase family protein [Nitratidesulfovibrio sp. SRB-5]|uniref:sugar phosphate isomerase/epimerase family protein n=1 Tax=Nitratidesulfovibrio sp. SRB-5 TaxID=2872636 RepID=UPI001027B503|nr:sugar phosphate isomerase/epimerase [Nitratidesulfovibrio sp. SRB-5]MBZ2170773.1 sugar phosphate isomerase/epimerase [Nitratidesulfovibrio sp. SRB-5]RXF76829.1 sugar phosphate isomerase/epimerase [Desulfovibrio sp. DS-1]
MHTFVNLPLSWVVRDPAWLDRFAADGLAPELGIDTFAVQELTLDWHRDTARRLVDAGLACAVHLPFFDLHPGSLNNAILAASRDTLRRAAELAALYAPRHMVGHAAFDNSQHGGAFAAWLERACGTWAAVLEVCAAPVHIENTHERDPEPVVALVDALAGRFGVRAGICFDAGHWHSFAGGAQRRDLRRWLDAFAPRLAHLHLHDNDGSDDQHLGLGTGSIPLDDLFGGLMARGLHPTATLEPHDEASFAVSRAWLAARKHYADVLTSVNEPSGEPAGTSAV